MPERAASCRAPQLAALGVTNLRGLEDLIAARRQCLLRFAAPKPRASYYCDTSTEHLCSSVAKRIRDPCPVGDVVPRHSSH
jgi:hypothetical protein